MLSVISGGYRIQWRDGETSRERRCRRSSIRPLATTATCMVVVEKYRKHGTTYINLEDKEKVVSAGQHGLGQLSTSTRRLRQPGGTREAAF